MSPIVILFDGFKFINLLCETSWIGLKSVNNELQRLLLIGDRSFIEKKRVLDCVDDFVIKKRFEFV